jgi:hypothetical protein
LQLELGESKPVEVVHWFWAIEKAAIGVSTGEFLVHADLLVGR